MKNIKRLFGILGQWKGYYILSAILLIASTLIRMLEPKVLQITIDKLVMYMQSGTAKISSDAFAKYLFGLLPEMKGDNVVNILLTIAVIFLIFSFFRAGFWFISAQLQLHQRKMPSRN